WARAAAGCEAAARNVGNSAALSQTTRRIRLTAIGMGVACGMRRHAKRHGKAKKRHVERKKRHMRHKKASRVWQRDGARAPKCCFAARARPGACAPSRTAAELIAFCPEDLSHTRQRSSDVTLKPAEQAGRGIMWSVEARVLRVVPMGLVAMLSLGVALASAAPSFGQTAPACASDRLLAAGTDASLQNGLWWIWPD